MEELRKTPLPLLPLATDYKARRPRLACRAAFRAHSERILRCVEFSSERVGAGDGGARV